MDRCAESAGIFRISFTWLDMPPDKPERAMVMSHYTPESENLSILSTEPSLVEICVHELDWLSAIPGKQFNPYWRFSLERVGDPPPPPPLAKELLESLSADRWQALQQTVSMAMQMGSLDPLRALQALRNIEQTRFNRLPPLPEQTLLDLLDNVDMPAPLAVQ